MNSQYLHLFPLCYKFKLNSNLSLLMRWRVASTVFPVIRFWHAQWDILFPSSLSSNMIATYGLHRKVKIKICYVIHMFARKKPIYGFLKYVTYVIAYKETNIWFS
jgi:hypothetical protein